MTAPATAPIGPSTTAPDTAPSAASLARSSAIAAEDISARKSAALWREPKGTAGKSDDQKLLHLVPPPSWQNAPANYQFRFCNVD
jgi:hypothetical protein